MAHFYWTSSDQNTHVKQDEIELRTMNKCIDLTYKHNRISETHRDRFCGNERDRRYRQVLLIIINSKWIKSPHAYGDSTKPKCLMLRAVQPMGAFVHVSI